MKTLVGTITGIAAGLCLTFSAQAQTLADGIKKLEYEQYKTAKTILTSVAQKEPTNARPYYYLGQIELHYKNTEAATELFNKGKTLDFSDAYNHLGLLELAYLKNDAAAILELTKTVTSKAGKDAVLYSKLALLLAEQPKPDMATAMLHIEKAKKIKETEPEIYVALGDIHAISKKTGDAANSYELALYHNKTYSKAYYRLGVIYKRGRNFKLSESNLLKAIESDANYIPAYRTVSELYIMAQKFDKAAEYINKCISLSEPDIELKSLLSRVLFLNKDYDGAFKIAQEVLNEDKKDANAWRIMAYTANEKNEIAKGLEAIKTFFSLATEDKTIAMDYEYYAQLLLKNKEDSLAVIQYNNAYAFDSSKVEYKDSIVKIFERKKDQLNTVKAYEGLFEARALNNLPIKSSEYLTYGRNCYSFLVSEAGKKDTATSRVLAVKADSAFSKVEQLSPSSPLGSLFRARTNATRDPLSNLGLGKPHYEKVITIGEVAPEKYKKELMESYKYLGFYYYVKYDEAIKANKSADKAANKEQSKQYWEKAKTIDPNDVQVIEALKALSK